MRHFAQCFRFVLYDVVYYVNHSLTQQFTENCQRTVNNGTFHSICFCFVIYNAVYYINRALMQQFTETIAIEQLTMVHFIQQAFFFVIYDAVYYVNHALMQQFNAMQ